MRGLLPSPARCEEEEGATVLGARAEATPAAGTRGGDAETAACAECSSTPGSRTHTGEPRARSLTPALPGPPCLLPVQSVPQRY